MLGAAAESDVTMAQYSTRLRAVGSKLIVYLFPASDLAVVMQPLDTLAQNT